MGDEFKNAFDSARMQHDFNPDADKIQQALNRGMAVVVGNVETYCPHTDAIMGTTTHFVVATSAERAQEIADKKNAAHQDNYGGDAYIIYSVVKNG